MEQPGFLSRLWQGRGPKPFRVKRDILSRWAAVFCAGIVVLAVAKTGDTRLFMPGPVTTAHGTLKKCSSCHSGISSGPFGWVHMVFADADPEKDSATCLKCHEMGPPALNPHGLELARLEAYVRRAQSSDAAKQKPIPARIRDAALPVQSTFAEGVFCATCHKEHKGEDHSLAVITDAKCHTCHAVQFGNFNKDHPEFDNYPFRRRTRIAFDHGGHINKHWPEWRKKNGAKDVPKVCKDCHTPSTTGAHMGLKPFEETCTTCHLGQIVGAERATGPKGIALLTLPGLDVETLKEKGADIGEWPPEAEGEISPLMKLLIGYDAKTRALVGVADKLDLLDLTSATPEQLSQVTGLAWEIKRLFHSLTNDGASALIKRLGKSSGKDLNPSIIAALVASLPYDVLLNARREWLPKLNDEIAEGRGAGEVSLAAAAPPPPPTFETTTEPEKEPSPDVRTAAAQPAQAEGDDAAQTLVSGDNASWRIDPFGRMLKGNQPPEEEGDASEANSDDRSSENDSTDTDTASQDSPAEENSSATRSIDVSAGGTDLSPEELAKHGGWYRQDYSILYKPTGHADPFLKAWLDLTGRLYDEKDDNPAVPAFDALTHKDAQGQCTKCHSVDARRNLSRIANWSPSSLKTRESSFTVFMHAPHFPVVEEKGCLTCHELRNSNGFQDSYKGNDPYKYVSNFKTVKRETCASCHGAQQVREDCLLCHKYHVNEVSSPVTATRIPEK